ncbi:MAG: flagellar protein FlgN [Alistipes senegalensis]|nr:flagellar protein FlgN [Oxalobacter formigenes]MCM1281953.1 flagellar protein FlgN [Alistipes senegalensis]
MTTVQTAMENCLNQEIGAARKLIDILQEEQNQLLSSSIDGLEPLVAKKAALVVELSQYTRERHEYLKQAGQETTLAGMEAWLANEPAAAQAAQNWQELVSLSRSAKELNRLNGMLISSHMSRNQQALAILRGNSQPNTGNYGPDGHPSRVSATPLRSVVTA